MLPVPGAVRGIAMARKAGMLEASAGWATTWTGSSWAFALALASIALWIATGPLFHYSDTWQLVVNTATTIITFLMVFLIQRSQNKESRALQLKLNELIAAVQGASNRLINVEDLSEAEIRTLHTHYERLLELAKRDERITTSHSVEEASERHRSKLRHKQRKAPDAPAERARIEEGEGGAPAPAGRPAEEDMTSHDGMGRPASRSSAADVEDEIQEFLSAAERLEARLRWHEEQVRDHEERAADVKRLLAEQGIRPPGRTARGSEGKARKPGPARLHEDTASPAGSQNTSPRSRTA
jgi:low affinity Fe/Cu permease